MSVLNLLNKKNITLLTKWAPTLATFGATGGALVLYFTDWKLVTQFIPIYNTKYKTEE